MKPIFSLRTRDISRSERRETSIPSSQYVPCSKASRSPETLRKVVFPEPEGPVMVTNSPSSTSSVKSRSARVSTIPVR